MIIFVEKLLLFRKLQLLMQAFVFTLDSVVFGFIPRVMGERNLELLIFLLHGTQVRDIFKETRDIGDGLIDDILYKSDGIFAKFLRPGQTCPRPERKAHDRDKQDQTHQQEKQSFVAQ